MTAVDVSDVVPQEEINRRLARYYVTRNGRDLWPEVPVRAFRAAEKELARVAALVLNPLGSPVALTCPPGTEPRALGVAARASAVGALVGYWCETGRVTAEPPVADLFARHLDDGRRRGTRLRKGFDEVLVALAHQGIEVYVLKGTHTGYRYFPEPGTRIASDIDILVRPSDWGAARQVLGRLGFVEQHIGPGDVRGMSDSVTAVAPGSAVVETLERTHADHPWAIDLHRSLNWTPFPGLTATLGTPDLGAGEIWREFCRPVRVLRQPLLLAYLALHASGHFYSMTQVRLIELVLVARRDFAGRAEHWAAFEELVARSGVGRFVFPALDLADRLVPGTMNASVLERLAASVPSRVRRIVRSTQPASAQRLHPLPGLRERLVWVASLREALAALAWLAWPYDGDGPASPREAIGAQWRRVRRAVRRIVQAQMSR